MAIKGITVTLYERIQSGTDDFNRPTYTETPTAVDNVLVYPATSTEVLDSVNLTGKKLVYTMAIPKGDTHDWRDRKVEFFGQTFHTFGDVIEGIEENLPLDWNKQVKVEHYE